MQACRIEVKGGLNSIKSLDDLVTDPSKLSGVSPDELYDYLIKNGYDVQPLSRGSYKGVPFDEGGGFKVNWGGEISSREFKPSWRCIL